MNAPITHYRCCLYRKVLPYLLYSIYLRSYRCNNSHYFIYLDSFFHSSDESPDSSTSSSIVFQSLNQAPTDAAQSSKVPPTETHPVKALVPTQEKSQVVCPKTVRCIPKNFVPCVFLGQQELISNSKCPATGWDSSAPLEERPSRSSIELNNSFLNKECQQWPDICTTKPSKEASA